jgi:hypothetical protein
MPDPVRQIVPQTARETDTETTQHLSGPAQVTARAARARLDLSTAQIGAGAAASVTSALAASFFGVAGTLIGAAVGSVVSTVASAIYAHSLRRAADRARVTREVVIRRATGAIPAAVPTVPAARTAGEPPVAPEPQPAGGGGQRPWWRSRPVAAAGVALGAFLLAVGAITASELALGRSASGGNGTTVSRALSGSSGTSRPTPSAPTTATTSPTASPTAPASSSSAPSAGTTTAPSTAPAPTASATGTVSPTSTAAALDPAATQGNTAR